MSKRQVQRLVSSDTILHIYLGVKVLPIGRNIE